jgi:uncharacterized protein
MPAPEPWQDTADDLNDLHALRAVYTGQPGTTSLAKEADHIHPLYQPYIEASPFVALATMGQRGLDVSPRGDPAGFVQVADRHTLLLPDRAGNHRIDSLRNIMHNPQVALLFLIPGVGETLRVNGRARISVAPALLERFVMQGKLPRSVLIVSVQTVFFQCARAFMRSGLWEPETWPDEAARAALPTAGTILGTLSAAAAHAQGAAAAADIAGDADLLGHSHRVACEVIDGAAYDAALRPRQRGSLY